MLISFLPFSYCPFHTSFFTLPFSHFHTGLSILLHLPYFRLPSPLRWTSHVFPELEMDGTNLCNQSWSTFQTILFRTVIIQQPDDAHDYSKQVEIATVSDAQECKYSYSLSMVSFFNLFSFPQVWRTWVGILHVGPDLCFKGESINRYLATATMSMGIVQSYPRLYWGFHFPNLVNTEIHLSLNMKLFRK